jgi:hypothetical protein
MSKFLHGPPKFSRGTSVVRGPPVGDRSPRGYHDWVAELNTHLHLTPMLRN